MKHKIAYQGIEGAYSEEAIKEFSQKNKIESEPVSSKNFRDLFDKIGKETHLGFVPIENSNAGSVVQCYDLFLEYDFEIIAEYLYRVNHNLLGLPNSEIRKIKSVYSHPQALAQCSKFIEDYNIDAVEFSDTASASKFISECGDKTIASIASKSAAIHYGLTILEENIQNSDDNITRFFLVKKKDVSFDFEEKLQNRNKTSIIFETRDIPAALYKALGGFATNKVNLTKIESRPSRLQNFHYIFYIDLDGSINDENVKLALEELNYFSKKVIILGSYQKY